jgi:hypothetical protein
MDLDDRASHTCTVPATRVNMLGLVATAVASGDFLTHIDGFLGSDVCDVTLEYQIRVLELI